MQRCEEHLVPPLDENNIEELVIFYLTLLSDSSSTSFSSSFLTPLPPPPSHYLPFQHLIFSSALFFREHEYFEAG